MSSSLESSPTGDSFLHVPCPGGQRRFHILFDQATALFGSCRASPQTAPTARIDCLQTATISRTTSGTF